MSNVHRNRYAAAGESTLSRHVTRVTCVRARDFSFSLSLSLSLPSFLYGCECDMCKSARTSWRAIAVAGSPAQEREKEGYEFVVE